MRKTRLSYGQEHEVNKSVLIFAVEKNSIWTGTIIKKIKIL